MTTYVVGHGCEEDGRPETIVPEGGSITFCTDDGYDLQGTNALKMLFEAGAASGYRVEGGQPIPNYLMSALTDNQMVRSLTAQQTGLTAVYVGDGVLPHQMIHLCEGDDTMCGGGRHICGGVFGRIDDPHLVYVACRGLDTAPLNLQDEYGATGDDSHHRDLQALVAEIQTLSEEEQGRKLCEIEDGRDPDLQPFLAMLMEYRGLRKAAYKERTRQYIPSVDAATFAAMFQGQPAQQQEWMQEIPEAVEMLNAAGMQAMFGSDT